MQPVPLFISAAISTVLQIGYQIIIMVITYLALNQIADIAAEPIQAPGFPTMVVSGIAGIGCLGMILAPLLHIGTGLLYAILHHRQGNLSLEDGAFGGGLAAGTASMIGGLISTLFSQVSSQVLVNNVPGAMPSDTPFGFWPLSIGATLLSSLPGLCFSIVIAAVLGLAGGLIGGGIFHNRNRT
ncbi:MAG: hypothetical protein JW726_05340 [Anaerolineales bacterium]|nr:hypothetical protein [Anaerolineales bacterium]